VGRICRKGRFKSGMKERLGDGKVIIIRMLTTKLVNTASDRDQTYMYSALPFSLTLKLTYDL